MYARRSNTIGDNLGRCALLFGMAAWVSQGFHINYFLSLLIVVAVWMGWVGIVLGTSSLLEWRRRAKPCAHGVKQHGLTCTICAQEREQQIAAQKKYRAEREQAEMLKTHAQRLSPHFLFEL